MFSNEELLKWGASLLFVLMVLIIGSTSVDVGGSLGFNGILEVDLQ